MRKPTVGIIGNGFVGEAQAFAFSPVCNIKIYDVDPLKSTHTLNETHDSDFVFICSEILSRPDKSITGIYLISRLYYSFKFIFYVL